MSSQLPVPLCAVVLTLVASCADPSAPTDVLAALNSELPKGPVVYVLTQIGEKVQEPAIIFDHECTAGRLTTAIHDTITLSANGTVRRATRTIVTSKGTVQEGTTNVTTGLWRPVTQPNLGYYSASPSLEATFWIGADSTPVGLMVRLRGSTEFTRLGSLGGSCPGSSDDTRNAEFVYSRR
ncbi:MAG: hypothetical protein ABI625_19680 [bacterium]